jgi:GNAT superfamily N-acetyltransferase
MIERLGNITLKNGEQVEASVVKGPDTDWAPRIGPLLQHKGDPWNWQVAQVLERDLELGAYFYILHRGDVPFANIMTIEANGLGIFGHVWTNPEDRKKGASSQLMALQMDHFTARGGRALFLGTGYESVAYKMYQRFGFESIEPESGYMTFYTGPEQGFNSEMFQTSSVDVVPLAWSHWPMMQPLFMGGWPGAARMIAYGLKGRMIAEEEPLAMIQTNEQREMRGETPNTFALRSRASQAIVGVASLNWHPLWQSGCLLDIYCHPDFWNNAPALLDALEFSPGTPVMAYADSTCPQKVDLLKQHGFTQQATLPKWIDVDTAKSVKADLIVLTK